MKFKLFVLVLCALHCAVVSADNVTQSPSISIYQNQPMNRFHPDYYAYLQASFKLSVPPNYFEQYRKPSTDKDKKKLKKQMKKLNKWAEYGTQFAGLAMHHNLEGSLKLLLKMGQMIPYVGPIATLISGIWGLFEEKPEQYDEVKAGFDVVNEKLDHLERRIDEVMMQIEINTILATYKANVEKVQALRKFYIRYIECPNELTRSDLNRQCGMYGMVTFIDWIVREMNGSQTIQPLRTVMMEKYDIYEFNTWTGRITAMVSSAMFLHSACLGVSGFEDETIEKTAQFDAKNFEQSLTSIRADFNRDQKYIQHNFMDHAFDKVEKEYIINYKDMNSTEFVDTVAANLTERYPFREWQVVSFDNDFKLDRSYFVDIYSGNAKAFIDGHNRSVFVSSVVPDPDRIDYKYQVELCRVRFINSCSQEEKKKMVDKVGLSRMIGDFIKDHCKGDLFNGSYSALIVLGESEYNMQLDHVALSKGGEALARWAFWYWYSVSIVVPYDVTSGYIGKKGDYCFKTKLECGEDQHCCGDAVCCNDADSCIEGECVKSEPIAFRLKVDTEKLEENLDEFDKWIDAGEAYHYFSFIDTDMNKTEELITALESVLPTVGAIVNLASCILSFATNDQELSKQLMEHLVAVNWKMELLHVHVEDAASTMYSIHSLESMSFKVKRIVALMDYYKQYLDGPNEETLDELKIGCDIVNLTNITTWITNDLTQCCGLNPVLHKEMTEPPDLGSFIWWTHNIIAILTYSVYLDSACVGVQNYTEKLTQERINFALEYYPEVLKKIQIVFEQDFDSISAALSTTTVNYPITTPVTSTAANTYPNPTTSVSATTGYPTPKPSTV